MLRSLLKGIERLCYLFLGGWTRLDSHRPSNVLVQAVALALVWSAPAGADTITFTGNTAGSTDNLGNFSATLSYNASSSTSAALDVTLTNTSPASNGGFLTAFVLNNPSGAISGVTAGSTFGANFSVLGLTNNGINAMPFGDFDFGASTGGAFQGGGNPSVGIGVGSTEVFDFHLTGTNLNLLSASDFASALSSGASAGHGDQYFAARFRGFHNSGSDKVPADPPSPPAPMPEPTTFVLWAGLGLGLAGGIAVRKYLRVKHRTGCIA